MRCETLYSSRFYAVDSIIDRDAKLLKSGWVYIDGYLGAVETLKDETGIEIDIEIPVDIRRMTAPSTFSFPDDTVDWRIIDARYC